MSQVEPTGTDPSDERTLASLAAELTSALDDSTLAPSGTYLAEVDDAAVLLVQLGSHGDVVEHWHLAVGAAERLLAEVRGSQRLMGAIEVERMIVDAIDTRAAEAA